MSFTTLIVTKRFKALNRYVEVGEALTRLNTATFQTPDDKEFVMDPRKIKRFTTRNTSSATDREEETFYETNPLAASDDDLCEYFYRRYYT